MNQETIFTASAVLDLLMQIDELKDYDIDLRESDSGDISLTIGDSVYDLNTDAAEVEVEPEVVDEVSDINEENLSELENSANVELYPVESGVLKELAKTLMIGGIVRLTKKLLS